MNFSMYEVLKPCKIPFFIRGSRLPTVLVLAKMACIYDMEYVALIVNATEFAIYNVYEY